MATLNPGITPADRLSFTVFLATAVHAIIILGVTFTFWEKSPSTHTMEITLAQHQSRSRPQKADFLAQFNQAGSGTLEDKALTTTPNQAQFHDTVVRETSPVQQVATAPEVIQKSKPVVTTTNSSSYKTPAVMKADAVKPKVTPVVGEKTLLERSLEIASLEARLDQQRQIYAKRPRIKRLTSLSTAASADAFYLNSWRRKIERIGNLNYPAAARRDRLYGSLRVMVAISPDGSLREVELLESSGHNVLDQAAIRIVRLASPFAPFPDQLRETTDVLEIIRTWQFRKNNSMKSF